MHTFVIPPLRQFTIEGHENAHNMARYYTAEQRKIRTGARICPRLYGPRKNTMQIVKYPRVLYVKPSNKVYKFTKSVLRFSIIVIALAVVSICMVNDGMVRYISFF